MSDHDAGLTAYNQEDGLESDEARLADLADYQVLDTVAEPDFDDIAKLASHICEVPIALISLVDRKRQWFKAKVGFAPCETDLDSSVCRYVLDEPDLLVIPDLTRDERTKPNPLVTGEAAIRFYAGAPLRSPRGHVIGSLCIIDTKPRPDGLSPRQADMLRILARQVMGLMELRRAVTGRDLELIRQRQVEVRLGENAAQLRLGVAHWRGLFERLSEGFVIGQVVRGPDGQINDWVYVDVNAAWGEMVGIAPQDAIGRSVRTVFPGIEDVWVRELAQVVDTGVPAVFTHQVSTLQRWYEGRAFIVDTDRFAVIFLEVTMRLEAERRREAILRLNDQLRDQDTDAQIVQAAGAVLAEALDVSRVGLARLDQAGGFVTVEEDWALPGLASISGRHRLADCCRLQQEMAGTQPIVIGDVRTDERTRDGAQRFLDMGTQSLVNIPVVDRGKTVVIFFVHAAHPRAWSPENIAFLRNVANRIELAVTRLKSQADQAMLNAELSHRLKNTLAMVQAIAMQTMKGVTDRTAVSNFTHRLLALSQAHDVLVRQSWTAGPIREVIEAAVERLGQKAQFDISGPDLMLGPRTTLSLSLLLHELATNAIKYGGLSTEAGRIALRWRVEPGGSGPELVLEWIECGGPAVEPPASKGFGSRLIGSGLVGTGGVTLRYERSGFRAEMRAPLHQVEES